MQGTESSRTRRMNHPRSLSFRHLVAIDDNRDTNLFLNQTRSDRFFISALFRMPWNFRIINKLNFTFHLFSAISIPYSLKAFIFFISFRLLKNNFFITNNSSPQFFSFSRSDIILSQLLLRPCPLDKVRKLSSQYRAEIFFSY